MLPVVMKYLSGRELVGYIKERQSKQVRGLRQAEGIEPKLVIIKETTDNPVISKYVELKQRYGRDIGVKVDVQTPKLEELSGLIHRLNNDDSVHGIIVQLPLSDGSKTEEIVNSLAPEKDVDGLGSEAKFVSATATAISWLLAGYNIELRGREIAIVGQGRLVGTPLLRLLGDSGLSVKTYDENTNNLQDELLKADVVISATGQPGLIKPEMLKPGAVVVDAGTTSEGGKLVGDVAKSVYERDDLSITPKIGGVGPLTVAALFDSLIQATRAKVRS